MDDDDTRIVIDSILEQTLNNLYGRSNQATRRGPRRQLLNCNVPELQAYYKLYGNVLVPPHFVFPDGNGCPAALVGFPLGKCVTTMRQQYWQTTQYTIKESDKAKLQELGFEFKASKARYALRYHELSLFKSLHGHLLVDRNYTIPSGNDSPWPYPHHGCRLGQVVKNIRNKQTFSDYRENSRPWDWYTMGNLHLFFELSTCGKAFTMITSTMFPYGGVYPNLLILTAKHGLASFMGYT